MKRNNHYISQFFLKHWANKDGKVWCYRTLVANENIPLFKLQSVSGIAYHRDLYTRMVSGAESDEIENMFDREFEAPAKKPLEKLISNQKLRYRDWKKIIRFLAMQDVRTPRRLFEHIEQTSIELPEIMESVLNNLVKKLENGGVDSKKSNHNSIKHNQFPMRYVQSLSEDPDHSLIGVETVVGRGTWLWSIEHLLNSTINHLYGYHWQILHPAKGYVWPISDTPVIRLNYYENDKYDFKGGWGRISIGGLTSVETYLW